MKFMNLQPSPDWRRELARASTHKNHNNEEFLTAVAQIAESTPQALIAEQLKTSQPQVSRWAAKGRSLLDITNRGQLGRSPYDLAQRYSRGEVSRDQIIAALAAWKYMPGETKTEGLHDDLLNYVVGSFDEVEAAYDDELIDDEIYESALRGLKSQHAASN